MVLNLFIYIYMTYIC